MQQAVVNVDKCSAHDKCPAREACPTRALLQMDPGEIAVVNGALCRGCGNCVAACPDKAIKVRSL